MRKYDTIQTTSKETTVYFNNAENGQQIVYIYESGSVFHKLFTFVTVTPQAFAPFHCYINIKVK